MAIFNHVKTSSASTQVIYYLVIYYLIIYFEI